MRLRYFVSTRWCLHMKEKHYAGTEENIATRYTLKHYNILV